MKKPTIFSSVIQKGGNGKTTTISCLGPCLAKLDKKILLIDFDPQSNLSNAFFSEEEINDNIYTLIEQDINRSKLQNRSKVPTELIEVSKVIKTYKCNGISFDLLPATPELYSAEFDLIGEPGREFFFQRILNKIIALDKYDYILIDAPPNLGILTVNILACNDNNILLIPVKRGRNSKKGIQHLFGALNLLQERGIARFKDFRFVCVEFFQNQEIDRATAHYLEESFPGKVFETKIRKNNSIDYAIEDGTDILNFAPDSVIAKDYMSLAKEIIAMEV